MTEFEYEELDKETIDKRSIDERMRVAHAVLKTEERSMTFEEIKQQNDQRTTSRDEKCEDHPLMDEEALMEPCIELFDSKKARDAARNCTSSKPFGPNRS